MSITDLEQQSIEKLLTDLNKEINDIISAREDISALLRIHTDINNDITEDKILTNAKARAKISAQNIVNLL